MSGNAAAAVAAILVSLLALLAAMVRPVVAVLPDTFGPYAHQFSPLPETTVGAHCRWEVRLDTVLDRVPSTITEVVCHSPDAACGGNANYRCRQIRARMVVAYHASAEQQALMGGTGAGTDMVQLVQKQNRTFSVGCSCVLNRPTLMTTLPGPMAKRAGAGFTPARRAGGDD